MRARGVIKYLLYSYCPGCSGAFPYFETKIYFPRKSLAFLAACKQGIYEAANIDIIRGMARRDSWVLDVGANIGLMAAPILKQCPDVHVLSFEPSPNVLPYLTRTIAQSPYRDRWELVDKAVGQDRRRVAFSLASRTNAVFDGIMPTNRVPAVRQIQVEMTSIDIEWNRLGKPPVSVVKCDVEGAELDVLCGAKECIESQKPAILLEWNAQNLKAYNCPTDNLLEFCGNHNYSLFSVPHLGEISDARRLKLHMLFTESFLMLPATT